MIRAKTKTGSTQMLTDGSLYSVPANEEIFVDWTTPGTEDNLCQCYWNGEIIYLKFEEIEINLPEVQNAN